MEASERSGFAFCDGLPYLPQGCELVLSPQKTCCFTGHRSKRLPSGEALETLRERVFVAVLEKLGKGVDTFITGMAEGFDLLAAETVVNFYARPCLRLICAVPYIGQFKEMKTEEDRLRYKELLAAAAGKVYFFEKFCYGSYHVRNQFMVNYSSHLIGYLDENGRHSGTGQTIRMAQQAGLDMKVITPMELIGS